MLLGVEGIVIRVNRVGHGLPAEIPGEEYLQRALSGSSAGRHQEVWRRARKRLAISIAVMAASKPLLPLLAPARSMACSSVFVVSTPNATGTPDSEATWARPLA